MLSFSDSFFCAFITIISKLCNINKKNLTNKAKKGIIVISFTLSQEDAFFMYIFF